MATRRPAPARPGSPPPGGKRGGGLAGWLRTREGKITAGAGAALLVVVLALRKGAGGGGEAAGGFLPSAIQGAPDGTLQPLLDQVGGGGGTLAEWISATTGLSGDVRSLTDLLEAQNPLPATTPTPAPAARKLASGATVVVPRALTQSLSTGKLASQYGISIAELQALNPALRRLGTVPKGTRVLVPDPRYYT